MEPGVQTPEETLATASGSCRDSRLAAGAAAAPPRPRGALRLRLPDPAEERRQVARRPDAAPRSTSPTCTPGARSTCPAPAGSASTRPRACSPAKATSRSPARPSPRRRRADQRRDRRSARSSSSTACRSRASGKRRASPALQRRAVGARSTRSASQVDADLRAQRRAPDAWAASRPSSRSTTATAREWNTEAMGPTKRSLSGELMERLRAQVRARAACCTTARASGIPGEQLPRWSLTCFWRKDGEPIWRDPALFADEHDDYGATDGAGARSSCAALAQRLGARSRSTSSRPTRTPGTTCGASASCRATSIRSIRASTIRWSATRLRQVFERRASTRSVGYVLPVGVDERRPDALADRPLVPARRALLPDPRRLAARLPPAARFAALGARRRPAVGPSRPTRRSRCAPLPPYRRCDAQQATRRRGTRRATPAARAVGRARDAERHARRRRRRRRAPARDAAHAPARQRIGRLDRRTAICAEPRERRALRLHAADVERSRTTSSSSPRSRPPPASCGMPVIARRLRAAARPAPRSAARHARPGRDRGQRPSGDELGRAGRADHASSTTPRARRA